MPSRTAHQCDFSAGMNYALLGAGGISSHPHLAHLALPDASVRQG